MRSLTPIVRTATRVATLPIAAASFATGLVKGTVSRLAHAVAGGDVPEPTTTSRAAPRDREPQVVPLERFPEAAPQREPAQLPDLSLVDESQPGLGQDPDEQPAAGSVVEALARNDRPGEDQVDHEAISAALSEAERLRGRD